ncbi:hypothetical protein BMW24_003060 [Mycobacterium heckeshornense]|uniref:Uncharacterized protein n=1 Tax=Mycobacterium heckeshornense TaxID=110505 RepID=A0A2G8BG48_9MYCO|nr:hypothetical protein [Mycobacterium heckeshornense]MCV7032798.1 hypothetical protein [Mycobacterium heckeshornense]PIJ36715.1 hypothetical protein BMW24_003060 [Mycobacterium heckeshornense]BCO35438.1 hypothetical protein MHEC_18710 [Mycobacterium heckeshornense]BCQ08593.1 hypothetical protein JMUB5695_02029 [Mycobacterium heckeshornense]
MGVLVERDAQTASDDRDGELAVDSRVRVYPGTEHEDRGTIVEDFGEAAGHAVDIGSQHIADPARRWAVLLDSGQLVFVDSDQLAAE